MLAVFKLSAFLIDDRLLVLKFKTHELWNMYVCIYIQYIPHSCLLCKYYKHITSG